MQPGRLHPDAVVDLSRSRQSRATTPTVWLDGLDIPIVNLFDTELRRALSRRESQPNTIPDGDSLARYGANMLPVDFSPARPSSPIFNYPYSRSRETLEELRRNGPAARSATASRCAS